MAALWENFDSLRVLELTKLLILAHVIASVVTYMVAVLLGGRLKEGNVAIRSERLAVLLITAHPDDECMFFSPVILKTTTRSLTSEVHVLCLTNGNYYGRGKQREKEITESCQILGIPAGNVSVINDSTLADDPKAEWKSSSVEHYIRESVDRIRPQQIFTFDDYGVSGHSNHIKISQTVRNMFDGGKGFEGVTGVFYLESVSVWRKYLGILDLPFSLLFSSHLYVLAPQDILRAQKAMLAHDSQMEWFRYLYILLSRYMLINTFTLEPAQS